MVTTRKTTTEEGDDAPRGINWKGVLIILAVFACLFVGCSCTGVVGYGIYRYNTWERVDPDDDDRKPSPGGKKALVKAIQEAEIAPEHCLHLSYVFKGIAARLETDDDLPKPQFTSRKELTDLIGAGGILATAGVKDMNYRDFPDIMEMAFEEVWETGKDGNLASGPLEPGDKKEFIERCETLADSFQEVAQ